MEEKANKRKFTLSEEERKKFEKKLEEAWSSYMFDFNMWRRETIRIKIDYNGFGIELPDICIEIEDLFKNFVDVEIKKAKNKKYQKYLTIMFKEED